MSEIQSGEAVPAASRETRREFMLILGSRRVTVRVVGCQRSVDIALKAFTSRKSKAITLGHLIGQIDRTHVLFGYGLRYVDDGIGIVESGHTFKGQVRLERVVRVNVAIGHRQLPSLSKLPENIGARALIQRCVIPRTRQRQGI